MDESLLPPEGQLRRMDVAALVSEALAIARDVADDEDDRLHTYFGYVGELQRRGDEASLRTALALCADADPVHRVLALHILGQLGWPRGRPHLEVSLPVAIECAADHDPRVVSAAVIALGHLGDHRGLDVVLRHVDNPLPATGATPSTPRSKPAAADAGCGQRRCSRRRTNFRPDQSWSRAATFTSTRPRGRSTSRRASSVTSLS